MPAGNTFSTPAGGLYHIFNNTSSVLTYYHYNNGAQTPTSFNGWVAPGSLSNSNECPTHIGVIGKKLTHSEILVLSNTYDSSETAYLNLLYSYNQLMDGGSTNALLTQIQQTWSSEALQLRDQLLAHSPYLSDTVLREAANRNILPQAMLLAVCLANPDGTKDAAFLNFLQFEIQNPLPQYMIDMIMASWNQATARTAMESTLANFSHLMAIIR